MRRSIRSLLQNIIDIICVNPEQLKAQQTIKELKATIWGQLLMIDSLQTRVLELQQENFKLKYGDKNVNS
jgi:cell division protein FtsL